MNDFISCSQHGIEVHVLPRPQNKRVSIHYCFVEPLDEGHLTEQTLVPHLLLQGSVKYPSAEAWQAELDRLYGAELKVEKRRVGNRFVVEYRLEFVHERYMTDDVKILEAALDLLHETLYNPHTEAGVFSPTVVLQEIERQRQRMAEVEGEPHEWAKQRLREEMFPDSTVALPLEGKEESLAHCSAESLWKRYIAWLRQAHVHVYIVGSYAAEYMIEQVLQRNPLTRTDVPTLPEPEFATRTSASAKWATEQVEGISLLLVGLQCGDLARKPAYPLLIMLYNLLFVFQHSWMVVEMRHRRQFTYDLGCVFDEGTGTIFVTTELDQENWQTFATVFDEIMHKVRTERLTEEELALLQRVSINNIKRRYLDTTWRLVDFHLKMTLLGSPWTVRAMCERFATTTAEELLAMAQHLVVDTIFAAGEKEVLV